MSDHEGCSGIFMASSSETGVSSPVFLPVTGQSSQRSLRNRADRKPDQDIACPMRKQNNPRHDQNLRQEATRYFVLVWAIAKLQRADMDGMARWKSIKP